MLPNECGPFPPSNLGHTRRAIVPVDLSREDAARVNVCVLEHTRRHLGRFVLGVRVLLRPDEGVPLFDSYGGRPWLSLRRLGLLGPACARVNVGAVNMLGLTPGAACDPRLSWAALR